MSERTSYDTVVIGGGQSGLVTGYYLQQYERDFVILDAADRIGSAWRNRWDSLRLFTPARYSSLFGLEFPLPRHSFPTKDEMADYLEVYADHFDLPVRLGIRVDGLTREGDRFLVSAGNQRIEANNVVVAMSTHQVPTVPPFAEELDPTICQLHASDYRNPSQLQDGGVLVVGAANSGAEISLETVTDHETWLSGPDVGHVPFQLDSWVGRHLGIPFVLRILFHRIFTTDTPIGRKVRPKFTSKGTMLVRTKPGDIDAAGVERVSRTVGVQDGYPVVGDRVLDVSNVVWATGYRPDYSWIDLPIFDGDHAIEPTHNRGIVQDEPGLYFVGLLFLYAASSDILCGLSRDAKYVVDNLVSRSPEEKSPAGTQAHKIRV